MRITLKDLAQIPLFQCFKDTPWEFKSLIDHAQILHFSKDAIILNEGDRDDGALFVVYKGSVTIAKTIDTVTGRAKALATIREGEYFGEMSLFDNSPRSASVLAAEDTYLVKISKSSFDQLVQNSVELSSKLLSSVIRTLSDRLRRTNMELVVLYDTGKIISRDANLKKMCSGIVNRLCTSLNATAGLVCVYEELSGAFEGVAVSGEFSLSQEDIAVFLASMQPGKTGFICPRTITNPELETILDRVNMKTALAVPLILKSTIYGTIILVKQDGHFTDAELNLSTGVAQQASFAVENARNREDEAARQAYQKRKKR